MDRIVNRLEIGLYSKNRHCMEISYLIHQFTCISRSPCLESSQPCHLNWADFWFLFSCTHRKKMTRVFKQLCPWFYSGHKQDMHNACCIHQVAAGCVEYSVVRELGFQVQHKCVSRYRTLSSIMGFCCLTNHWSRPLSFKHTENCSK